MVRFPSSLARQSGLSIARLLEAEDRLDDLTGFGTNPGALIARTYIPEGLAPGAPLVVVLHGCLQTGAGYDHGAGWSHLADELGFAVLFPQQQPRNNLNLCFNWFAPVDSRRGSGEALSIRQMIATLVAAHGLDARRIFVTGLSAGGAMASIMLATYPEVFAGGAIIAGLPYGAARSVGDALSRMAGRGHPSDDALAQAIRDASPHEGPWPRLSVWQGTADTTVAPINAERILAQWQIVKGLAEPHHDTIDGALHRTWHDAQGRPVLEAWDIPGLGHGTPLHTDDCGAAGPFMLEAGISSTRHIAQFWGLDKATEAIPEPHEPGRGLVAAICAVLRRIGLIR